MSLVSYRVVDPVGGVFAGDIPANGFISLNGQREVSLNLQSSDIAGYARAGDALVVRLDSGESVTLSNFFGPGDAKELYVSSGSQIYHVNLDQAYGDGTVSASYEYLDASGKITPYDNLLFYQDDLAVAPMVGGVNINPTTAALAGVGLLAAGGAALALSSGGGGGGDGDRGSSETTPELDVSIAPTGAVDGIVNAAEVTQDNGILITGTTEPGATVDVAMLGATQTTTAGADGSYAVTFDRAILPADMLDADGGSPTVTATATKDGQSATTSRAVPLDLATEVAINAPVAGDNIINNAEASSGFTLTGTTEPGQTEVTVMFGATALKANVDAATGSWSVDVPASAIPAHNSTVDIQVTAVDHVSNTAQTQMLTVPVDRVVENLDGQCPPVQDVNGDRILNQAEAANGITLQGTTEANSQSVAVTLTSSTGAASTYAAAIAADGSWSVNVPHADLADKANYSVEIKAVDHAGNEAVVTEENCFSTDMTAPDYVMPTTVTVSNHGQVEALRIISTEDSLSFDEVTDQGAIHDIGIVTRDAFASGQTDIGFANGVMIPDGSDGILTAMDSVGNSSSTYIAFDDTAENGVDLDGLDDFNIDMIDLSFASDSELVLTPDLVKGLSENGDTLTIAGNSNDLGHPDDTVVIQGAVDTGQNVDVGGEAFSVYTFGDTTLNIDDEIKVVTSTP